MAQLTQEYFNRYPMKEYSAARIVYSAITSAEFGEAVAQAAPKDAKYETDMARVAEADTAEAMVRMMKRALHPLARRALREKMVGREDEILPILYPAALKGFSDAFIENMTEFFCACKTDVSQWIIDHYADIRYPYMRSMLCLVIGFRGGAETIPFLKEQLETFATKYSARESFEQGPLLALYQLSERFENI